MGEPFGNQFGEIMQTRRREADEFYRAITPGRLSEDAARVMRQALAGMLWTKQYFGFDVNKWLEEHGADPMLPACPADAEQRMVPHGERAHHLDAGQVGVSLVCRLGPGIPRHRALHGGCGFRERTARPVAAGILPAPERADSGIRVELQRCQSARARLGDDLPLQDRTGSPRRRRPGLSQAVLSKADVELHLVGEPQRPLRQERV